MRGLEIRSIVGRVRGPPVRDTAFWVIQATVVLLAAVHLLVDLHEVPGGSFPTGVPVGLLLVPVVYAALRYGLSGSVATILWAALLWLPDLALPGGRGHPDDDLVGLALVLGVSIVAGVYVERERRARHHAEALEAAQRAAESRWTAELLRVQEDERRRIARELHDDPLQRLIQVARHLDPSAPAVAEPSGPGVRPASVSAARTEVLDVVRQLRDLTRGLRPAGLEEFGLVAALRALLAEIEANEGPATDLDVGAGADGAARPPREVELALYRIAQEAARNSARHAHAAHLTITVAGDDGCVCVTIADDGRGMDVARAEQGAHGHFGLLGMRERARLIGGSLDVDSAPGRGTIVTAVVPKVPRTGGTGEAAVRSQLGSG